DRAGTGTRLRAEHRDARSGRALRLAHAVDAVHPYRRRALALGARRPTAALTGDVADPVGVARAHRCSATDGPTLPRRGRSLPGSGPALAAGRRRLGPVVGRGPAGLTRRRRS